MRVAKKIIRDMLIVLGLLLLAASNVRKCMEQISNVRNKSKSWWGAHQSLQGDLIKMSYLDDVPALCDTEDYRFIKPAYSGPKQVALYTYGDSYIRKVPDSAYAGIVSYKYAWRSQYDLPFTLDRGKKNILLIEVAERFVRDFVTGTEIFDHVYDSVQKTQAVSAGGTVNPMIHPAVLTVEKDDIFNPNINQNLEYNIFNYNFLNPVRKCKALMTYDLFHRASGLAILADEGDHLLLKTTTLPVHNNSSYEPLTDEKITQYVQVLNTICDHYREAGFAEVYLSLIPNPATILQPEGYNRMIPRIERNAGLKMKVVSVYDAYRSTRQAIYRRGDTHWNNNGLQLWLQQVNAMLAAENYKASR